ncbi:MAG: hypothetical protein AB7P37_15670 [Ramlibacter sp.]
MKKTLLPTALLAALLTPLATLAQSSCSSDGQPRPVALLERFINADCASCWSDPQARNTQRGEVALDWIVPGSRGDDAPLSAAATRDSLARLQALGRQAPPQADEAMQRAAGKRTLRVAHGMPFNDYIGASIEMKPAARGPWTAWLALVETVPVGTEGTAVERNLVRNLLQVPWQAGRATARLLESRPMWIAEGARAERLRVIGWVEDARGRIHGIAQSVCDAAR